MKNSHQRRLYALWLLFICCFALLYTLHLRADFPNHTPWTGDWAKYTDEGWYGNAAIRAHLFGNWYLPGDLNFAPAVPVWPFFEWVLFFFTGVSIQAARGLAVAIFFCNLLLTYLLLRPRGPRWMAFAALAMIVTCPFIYCFSRLAILEPMLIAFTLAALNLAVRLPHMRRPVVASCGVGLLFSLMVLTKTYAVFLLPALVWAMVAPFWPIHKLVRESTAAGTRGWDGRIATRCVWSAAGVSALVGALWLGIVIQTGHFTDLKYFLFSVNHYPKPSEIYWPLLSFWWSLHGGLWVDIILFPLAVAIFFGAVVLACRSSRARKLLLDPVFGASVLAVAEIILFMTYQNNCQPRYYSGVAFFCCIVIAQGIAALLDPTAPSNGSSLRLFSARLFGWTVMMVAVLAAVFNAYQTLNYAAHPEYSFVDAAERLTRYIDAHPNGKRILVASSGDEITLITHLPALSEEHSTGNLDAKLARYQPGWFATWNDFDPATLAAIHTHFSVEQVASFRAFDGPIRNVLVLFKLHLLPGGQTRNPSRQNLQVQLDGDKIEIEIEMR